MKSNAVLLAIPFSILVASGCGSGGGGGGAGGDNLGGAGGGNPSGTGGSGTSVACSGTSLVAKEANDYAFSSTLSFPPIKVAPKKDLTFDWGDVTKDFIRHPIDAKKDLNTILVFMWKLSLPDLQSKLNDDNLAQRDLVTLPLSIVTDGSTTTGNLLKFSNTGNPTETQILSFLDATTYDPANYTYTLMAATGTTLGQGTKMIQSFQLDPNSTNTAVKMTSDSTKLTYTANLHSLTPTGIPVQQKNITLDWGQMTTNALGSPFVATNVTSALVAHYTQTPTELESQFLDLELIATKLYRGNIDSGSRVDFSALKTDGNETFPGIDGTGTWIVALQCGGCRNPAPWYLSILKPCS